MWGSGAADLCIRRVYRGFSERMPLRLSPIYCRLVQTVLTGSIWVPEMRKRTSPVPDGEPISCFRAHLSWIFPVLGSKRTKRYLSYNMPDLLCAENGPHQFPAFATHDIFPTDRRAGGKCVQRKNVRQRLVDLQHCRALKNSANKRIAFLSADRHVEFHRPVREFLQ